MALKYLVDTSVIKRLGQPRMRAVVEPLAIAGDLGRATICDLEVGYSARNGPEWDHLVGALDGFRAIPTTSNHLRRALQVQRLLAESQPARPQDPRPARRRCCRGARPHRPALRRRLRPDRPCHRPAMSLGSTGRKHDVGLPPVAINRLQKRLID